MGQMFNRTKRYLDIPKLIITVLLDWEFGAEPLDRVTEEEIDRLRSRLSLVELNSTRLIRQMEDHYALKMKEMESKVSDLQSGTKVTYSITKIAVYAIFQICQLPTLLNLVILLYNQSYYFQ